MVFDSEANGFLENVTKAHCICAVDVGTGERWQERDIPAALERLSKADMLVGHNILRYDLPVFAKLYGWRPAPWVTLRDTKVIARLIYPNVNETDGDLISDGRMPPGDKYRGRHTIASWGYRLGLPKLHEDITDWSEWTAEMEERCAGDVETNLRLWDYLQGNSYSQAAIDLEQRIDLLVWQMEQAGVYFDVQKAATLHTDLVAKRFELEPRLKKQFGFWFQPISPSEDKYLFKPKVNNKKMGYVKDQPYCKLKKVEFNPRSHVHVEKVLRARGWEPTEFTKSGRAKIDEPVLEAIQRQFPEMAGICELEIVNKRLGTLAEGEQALIKAAGTDGIIRGKINPMGAPTSRAAHFGPNLAQVPSPKKPWGERFRELFIVPPGWVLVGADMDGLEGRGLAHYLAAFDHGAYFDVLTNGDPHWNSARALGFVGPFEERDKHNQLHVIKREGAKRYYYAYVYGALEKKCGEIILDVCAACRKAGSDDLWHQFFGNSTDPKGEKLLWKVGERTRTAFGAGIEGLGDIVGIASSQVKRFNALKGLDGRIVPARAQHSALNFLIQSLGAILCKRWGVEAYDEITSKGYRWGYDHDFVFALWVHDEYQVACRKEIADEIGAILVKQAIAAGGFYGLRVPLGSSYSIGRNWAETH